MKIGSLTLNGQVILAPLAGYTNQVYRLIAKKMGASLVYSEMISAKGLLYENDKTWDLAAIDPAEHPVALQLFGNDPSEMALAASKLTQMTSADIIDINMGCPVRKVMKQNSGSFLLQDPQAVYDITRAVVNATSLPVTVKIRAGWTHDDITCEIIAQVIERAGAQAITIHGRTKSDLYKGHVNLDYIKRVKEAVSIPVIANGDIRNGEDAIHTLAYTGADAVMIGRATLGNPWVIAEVDAALRKTTYSPASREDRLNMMLFHLNELVQLKGEKIAILEMRSLAGWYVKGFPHAKTFKQALTTITTFDTFVENMKMNLYQDINNHGTV
ncbi:MAG: tRNA dihydrouridine synthase DusB [Bacilli bacterium]